MTKKLKVAGEVDAWCTSCKRILNHRIISMLGTSPHQVECLTCRKSHRYRSGEPGAKPEKAAAGRTVRTSTPPASSGAPSRKTLSAARAEQARVSHSKDWESRVSGHTPADFVPYTIAGYFPVGTLVAHKKFGEGVVIEQVDLQKIRVMFEDEDRILAQCIVPQ